MRRFCHHVGTFLLYGAFVVLLSTIVVVAAATFSGDTQIVDQVHRAVPTTTAVSLMGSSLFVLFAIAGRMLQRR